MRLEAAANAGGEKIHFIKISAYHKMTVVHIENSCGKVKWKKRMPVSDKGKRQRDRTLKYETEHR